MLIWLLFLGCTAVILYTGTKLSRFGDMLAEKTGLGRTWIGIILMATVTSLPELVTGVSAVAVFDVPDIAAGDVLGSCMFNVLLLAVLDAGHRQPLSVRVHSGHILSAGFGILLVGLVVMTMVAGARVPRLGWVSVSSFVFLAVYLLAMRSIFVYERTRIASTALGESLQYEETTHRRALTLFAVNAVALIAAASALPALGDRIAVMTGLGHTFVGSFLIAMATSLPEIVVSVAALRLGAADLAVGNVLGSNLFNIAVLGVDDIFYTPGPLLQAVSGLHLLTAGAAMSMTALAVIGLIYRARAKRFFSSWDSLGIVLVYAAATLLLYQMRQ